MLTSTPLDGEDKFYFWVLCAGMLQNYSNYHTKSETFTNNNLLIVACLACNFRSELATLGRS